MMVPRGSTVAKNLAFTIAWCETERRTPLMRVMSLQKLDKKRRRIIWHNGALPHRIAHVPARFEG